ncbi:hypothetical protein [Pseudomonas sp. NBRC 111127]|uniref:hypothetical protein n=1 Tax=Pseudomonas sp. NBRC 111127 TaxID=1661042 RepID=UPI000AC62C40|nr:hypothetical protein [Pseudomonas sp. NBRC 111127]
MANHYQTSPARPIVELNEWGEIDLDALQGKALSTFIKYEGMTEGDRVAPRWLSVGVTGEAVDDIKGILPIEEQDLERGLPVLIKNDDLQRAAGGWAFYSYTLNDTAESLRLFCYVGLRGRTVNERLPPALSAQAHGLLICPDQLESEGATFNIAPYQAMQIGDTIRFELVGFDEDGEEDDTEKLSLTVGPEHFDKKPLAFTVRRNFFRFIDPGSAQATYAIDFIDGQTLDAPPQEFLVDSEASWPGYLSKPAIVGHNGEGDDELDPAKFRDGLAIRVKAYPGMAVGDRVALYWRSPAGDVVQVMRVDPSTEANGEIPFHLPGEVALASEGLRVTLAYLYARPGVSLLSDSLQVQVKAIRQLDPPSVVDAVPEGSAAYGTLAARDAVNGAYVDVPDVAREGESVEVHWWGQAPLGRFVATQPVPANPRRFHIPAEYVPANMGRGSADQSRRFEVFYVLQPGGERSPAYNLRISPLQVNRYPTLVCDEGNQLSLKEVPPTGVGLSLGSWLFGAAGQLLTLSVTGVNKGGVGELSDVIRDGVPVSAEEAADGVKTRLPRSLLERLEVNEQFTLSARLSFDGGDYFTPFNSSTVTLFE